MLTVYHTYSDDEGEEVTDDDSVISPKRAPAQHASTSGTCKCRCGSTKHRKTNHHLCPSNKRKPFFSDVASHSNSDDIEEEIGDLVLHLWIQQCNTHLCLPSQPKEHNTILLTKLYPGSLI